MPSQFTLAAPGITLSSATPANVVSQVVQPGTYLVWGQLDFALSAVTATETQAGISLTSATMPTQAGGGGLGPEPLAISPLLVTLLTGTMSLHVAPTSLVLASAATVYLVARSTFAVGTLTVYGTLNILPALGTGFNIMAS
jgi:hypothetical protein